MKRLLAGLLVWGMLASGAQAMDMSLFTLPKKPFGRDPLVAGSLSLAFTGAGQWYKGEGEKALWLNAPLAVYPAAWLLDTLFDSSLFRTTTFLVMVGAKGYSVWDAYYSPVATPSARPKR